MKASIYQEVRNTVLKGHIYGKINEADFKKLIVSYYPKSKEATVIRAINMAIAELRRTEEIKKVALERSWGIFKKELTIIILASILIGFVIGKFL